MAISLATFLVNYPEFTNAPSGMVQNALDEAYALTPESTWTDSTRRDHGAQLRAAQTLALSQFGRGLQLSMDDGRTVYDSRLEDLCRAVVGGPVVL